MYHKSTFGVYNWHTGQYEFKPYRIEIKRNKMGYDFEVKRTYHNGDSYSRLTGDRESAIRCFFQWISENNCDNMRKEADNKRRGKNETII